MSNPTQRPGAGPILIDGQADSQILPISRWTVEKILRFEEQPSLKTKGSNDGAMKRISGDMLALFAFYAYTSKFQRTNIIKCTTFFATKGLGWSDQRTIRAKKGLIELGLVEDVRKRVGGDGTLRSFIKIRYYWSTENEDTPEIGPLENSTPPISGDKCFGSKTKCFGSKTINALDNTPLAPQGGGESIDDSCQPENQEDPYRATEEQNSDALAKKEAFEQSTPPPAAKRKKSSSAKPSMPTIPEDLRTPEFEKAWEEWKQHRKEIKSPLTPKAVEKQFSKLQKLGVFRAVAAIDLSIESGWRGIFEGYGKPPEKKPGSSNKWGIPTAEDWD